MLIRRLPIAFLPILASGAVLGLAPDTASAAPFCLPNACAHSVVTIPGGGGGSGGTGGGGGGGNTGPGLGCPAINGLTGCQPAAAAPAAQQHVPAIDYAYDARDNLVLPSPTISTAPSGRSYIRITTGLWVAAGDLADKTAKAGVPGEQVVVTASDPVVTWTMGDGGTVRCEKATAGTPGGTDCGYAYPRSSASLPGGKYTITATIRWTLSWTCQGPQCDSGGAQSFEQKNGATGTAALAVGEVQTQSQPR